MAMAKPVIKDGVYNVMGPGGQLTFDGGRITMMQPGYGDPRLQQWQAAFSKGSHTLRNVASGIYVGSQDPDRPEWMLRGTQEPFSWTLADGGDEDPSTFLVMSTDSSDGLRLSPSILRIWPMPAALAPPSPQFDFEWNFRPAMS
jgi:hypothetical protein